MCDNEHEMHNLLIVQFGDVHREHDSFTLWTFINEKLTSLTLRLKLRNRKVELRFYYSTLIQMMLEVNSVRLVELLQVRAAPAL